MKRFKANMVDVEDVDVDELVKSDFKKVREVRLEWLGYESGLRGEHVCFEHPAWSRSEKAAYRKGFNKGKVKL